MLLVKNTMIDHDDGGDGDDGDADDDDNGDEEEEELTADDSYEQRVSPSCSERSAIARSKNSKYSELRRG